MIVSPKQGLATVFWQAGHAAYSPILGTPLKWVVTLAALAFVFFFSFKIQDISAGVAQGCSGRSAP